MAVLCLQDLRFLERILQEYEQELVRARVVYCKPWPSAEEACSRLILSLQEQQEKLTRTLDGPHTKEEIDKARQSENNQGEGVCDTPDGKEEGGKGEQKP